ncbi:2'-5' RNA ligase family protein [Jeongeupia wiesaeckerbachi]|uniref:2'-5' RNA ligase family protein n=1 Tax=Jeongeupia wiesaeckerbachi TaxID=3051218 RepID=UPI003D801656
MRSIALYPSLPGDTAIESIRARFDPLHDKVPYHITLVFPFDSILATARLQAHVAEACTGMASFSITTGEVICEGALVMLAIDDGAAQIVELHRRLYRGLLNPFHDARYAFRPHITVGRGLTREAVLACAAEAGRLGTLHGVITTLAGEVIGQDDSSTLEWVQGLGSTST